MIADARDPDTNALPERRHGPRRALTGRRAQDEAADVGTDDLRALVGALERRLAREAEIAEERHSFLERRVGELEARLAKVTTRVLLAAGAFAAIVYLASWIGPTVIREAIRALLGP